MTNKKVFDVHCHLQDPRIYDVASQVIQTALDSGVVRFAVNGVSEKDWHVVKQMSERYPRFVIPCFGLHPWYVAQRTSNWFDTLKECFDSTPSATVGEIGLHKGSLGVGKEVDYTDQVQVFQQQLELARELQKPVSIHCVDAFGDLLAVMQHVGPLPGGAILHSYMGSAEMVPVLAKLGAYFSFSGHHMSMKPQKAKKILESVPRERILLESDSPDALPKSNLNYLQWVPGDASVPEDLLLKGKDVATVSDSVDGQFLASADTSTLPKETLNHPANIHIVLSYVASLLEIPEEEIAEISYRNALRLFSSYPGSEIDEEE